MLAQVLSVQRAVVVAYVCILQELCMDGRAVDYIPIAPSSLQTKPSASTTSDDDDRIVNGGWEGVRANQCNAIAYNVRVDSIRVYCRQEMI